MTAAETIKQFIRKEGVSCGSAIWLENNIPPELAEWHNHHYAHLEKDEQILLVLNKPSWMCLYSAWGWSGMMITNQRIVYRTVDDSPLGRTFGLGGNGSVRWSDLRNISICDLDVGFTYRGAYVGHTLYINNAYVGYLRMGTSIQWNDEALAFLIRLFHILSGC